MTGRRAASLFLFFAALFAAAPASASLTLCNRTSYILYAATAFAAKPDITTQGWTRLQPGACVKAISQPLKSPPYYVYAQSSRSHSGPSRAWGGNATFCVKHGNFSFTAPPMGRCAEDDAFAAGFSQIATGRKTDFTETLTDKPDLPTLPTNWRVKDAQVQSFNGRPSVVVTADSPLLGEVTLVAAPMEKESAVPPTPAEDETVPTVYWQNGGTAYAQLPHQATREQRQPHCRSARRKRRQHDLEPEELHRPDRQQRDDRGERHHPLQQTALEMAAEEIGDGDSGIELAGARDRRADEEQDRRGQQDVAEEPGAEAIAMRIDAARIAEHRRNAIGFADRQ